MTTPPTCPQCHSEYTYEDGAMYICPECSHEWPKESASEPASEPTGPGPFIRDAVGNVLQDGGKRSTQPSCRATSQAFAVLIGRSSSIRL